LKEVRKNSLKDSTARCEAARNQPITSLLEKKKKRGPMAGAQESMISRPTDDDNRMKQRVDGSKLTKCPEDQACIHG